ncbi:tRNA (adenosine(37)-N6)-threonylcarbamoyltransferase complex ATPase subunit type 1 TsaE [Paraferrimonas sp. SM1919]|uniref:tRNA (adenosine(37)-N6)-threonylcarbamoyltransferase complex ATPase subunit type 1 TsaE n=1 Tax=Paraferrimonas sp. SM1919 TaxID=2662263 RepID=UPI0013CF54E7|nr:tRNA (adenosine(37)-N6)-threonylcarbamoyltransferase complex ATPase subunit type 1 TsaE [Paraferrimonas sp. SM1919]
MQQLQIQLIDEQATVELGHKLAKVVAAPAVIYLQGELGAGKTTLSRGIIRGFGHQGNVKSPTYTLVEPYELADKQIFHFDLYRLADPEELEYMGIRDYFNEQSICLIEWPSQGEGFINDADLKIQLNYHDKQRVAVINGLTERGQKFLQQLNDDA